MSRKTQKVVCRASWRDFIFANFVRKSFSTATPDSVNHRLFSSVYNALHENARSLTTTVRPAAFSVFCVVNK